MDMSTTNESTSSSSTLSNPIQPATSLLSSIHNATIDNNTTNDQDQHHPHNDTTNDAKQQPSVVLPTQVNIALAYIDNRSDTIYNPPFCFVLLHLDKDKHIVQNLHGNDNHNIHTLECLREQIKHDFDTNELQELSDNKYITIDNYYFVIDKTIVPRQHEQDIDITKLLPTIYITEYIQDNVQRHHHYNQQQLQHTNAQQQQQLSPALPPITNLQLLRDASNNNKQTAQSNKSTNKPHRSSSIAVPLNIPSHIHNTSYLNESINNPHNALSEHDLSHTPYMQPDAYDTHLQANNQRQYNTKFTSAFPILYDDLSDSDHDSSDNSTNSSSITDNNDITLLQQQQLSQRYRPSSQSMYEPTPILQRLQTVSDGSNIKITITGLPIQHDDSNTVEYTIKTLYSVNELLQSDFYKLNKSTTLNNNPIWVSIENASIHDYDIIGRSFNLHPLTIEDCQTHSTREKLEIFTNYLFLVLHALDNVDRSSDINKGTEFITEDELNAVEEIFPTTPIRVIIFSNLILSFHHSDILTVDVVRRRLYRIYNNKIEATAWLQHAMLDCIVDSLLPVVESTSYEVDALDDLIYVLTGSEHRDLLRRMGLTRRRLLYLRQRLWSKRDILMSLIGKDWQLFLNGQYIQVPYMRDVFDHVVTMLHKIDAASDLLQTLQSTYLANVSIDVSDASQRTNNTVKRLTAVVTVVSPLTLIAGLQGMNIEVPFQHDAENTLSDLIPYISLISIMAAYMLATLWYFKRTNML